jgi:two-component system, OmpR family, alkaline phosphatase synthesis response regulator PhoP
VSDIFIIEDNRDIADGLRRNLEIEGFSVETAGNANDGLRRIRQHPPELVVLDLMLPDEDGFRVLRRLRDEGFEMPVLILSARAGETEKVRGFRIGADDYVTKPFSLKELLARIDALFRRRRRPFEASVVRPPGGTFAFGNIKVDLGSRDVFKRGVPIALRPKEFELLEALIQGAQRVVSRRELLERVWQYDAEVLTRTVDTHMVELRRKLEDDPAEPRHIITVRKAGYMLRL